MNMTDANDLGEYLPIAQRRGDRANASAPTTAEWWMPSAGQPPESIYVTTSVPTVNAACRRGDVAIVLELSAR